MIQWINRLFCNHEYKYLGSYQIYMGDWLDVCLFRFDKYKCSKCNKVKEEINIEL